MSALPVALPVEAMNWERTRWSGPVGYPFRPTTVLVKGNLL
jgi:hypothetical protein